MTLFALSYVDFAMTAVATLVSYTVLSSYWSDTILVQSSSYRVCVNDKSIIQSSTYRFRAHQHPLSRVRMPTSCVFLQPMKEHKFKCGLHCCLMFLVIVSSCYEIMQVTKSEMKLKHLQCRASPSHKYSLTVALNSIPAHRVSLISSRIIIKWFDGSCGIIK